MLKLPMFFCLFVFFLPCSLSEHDLRVKWPPRFLHQDFQAIHTTSLNNVWTTATIFTVLISLIIFRSLTEKRLKRVSAIGQLFMFQTYAGTLDRKTFVQNNVLPLLFLLQWNVCYVSCLEVTGVSPSSGSVMGGTLLTIHGRFFDETDAKARVLVGGNKIKNKPVVTSFQHHDNFSDLIFTRYKVLSMNQHMSPPNKNQTHCRGLQSCDGDNPFQHNRVCACFETQQTKGNHRDVAR